MRAGAVEQRGRFVQAALPPAQLAEARASVGGHAGPADRELVAGAGQLAFGFIPRASPHTHRRVLCPANGEQRFQSPLAAVFLDAVAPLNGAGVIAGAIAGANQVTAGERNQQTVGQLAGENRGTDLIDLAQAFADAPGGDEREPVQRASHHLIIDRADRLPDADGLEGQRVRRFRIAIVEQREHRGTRGEEGMFGGIGLAVQQS